MRIKKKLSDDSVYSFENKFNNDTVVNEKKSHVS